MQPLQTSWKISPFIHRLSKSHKRFHSNIPSNLVTPLSNRLSSPKSIHAYTPSIVSTEHTPVKSPYYHQERTYAIGPRRQIPPIDPKAFENQPKVPPPKFRVGGGIPDDETRQLDQSLGGGGDPSKNLPWEPTELEAEQPPAGYVTIEGFFDDAIRVNGKRYKHSLFVMPQFVVQWNVQSLEDITPESLALACVHYPSIRHVFIGVGYTLPCPTKPEWVDYLAQYKVTCEIVTCVTACRLFNMQNTLFQNFAAAILYEPHVVQRLFSLARKTDFGMPDPYAQTPI